MPQNPRERSDVSNPSQEADEKQERSAVRPQDRLVLGEPRRRTADEELARRQERARELRMKNRSRSRR